MTTLTKVIMGIVTTGTATGGGILLSKSRLFSQSERKLTLKDEIEKDKWTLLTASNSSEISDIKTAYKKADVTVTMKFSNLTGNESDFETRLLRECRSSYEKSSNTDSKEALLKQLKKWCVIPKTINQRLRD